MSNEIPSAGEIVKWFGAKTPIGLLLIALAFAVMCTGIWILAVALERLGYTLPV